MAKEKKQKKKKRHRFFWFVIWTQIILILLVVGGLSYYYFGGYADEVDALRQEARELVAATDEDFFVPSQTCSLYDKNGVLISERGGEKDAQYVNYEDIPALYITTIISIEDKKYFQHNGVDFKAVLRVLTVKLRTGQITQGGSTITMQLAKLMFLQPSKTWQYKVEQMFLAMELEKKYSKSQILEFYLNNIYFANGYYGIDAACHGYFNCELTELDTSQVAFLLAIPNSPTYYDPLVSPEHTLQRRNLILQNLRDDGKISQLEYEIAYAEEIELNPAPKEDGLWNNYVDTYAYHCATKAMMENEGFVFQDYFSDSKEEEAYDESYDEMYAKCRKKLYAGGYKIYTSIDMELQEQLQTAVNQVLSDYDEVNEEGVYTLQGAATCIDNTTGMVVAIVGGREQDFSCYTLNRAYQSHRQPGSAIKPLLVYTPQFERGYTPDSLVVDEEMEDGPVNAGGVYYGEVTLRFAIEHSLNTVAWKLYEELTPEVGLEYLKKMNFTDIYETDYVLPTALGGFTTGVSAVEMAAGYATIANDGKYRQPTCIRSIIDSNENVIYTAEQSETVIYEENAARMMTDTLVSVMQEGTGKKWQLDSMPCAGKTGTTNEYKDGWFVGYTRYYTTSVWVGYDMPQTIEELRGHSFPGEIWQLYMNQVHEDYAALEFLPPAG